MTKNIPPELDAITDTVLVYRPPEKAKATKERVKRKRKRDKRNKKN